MELLKVARRLFASLALAAGVLGATASVAQEVDWSGTWETRWRDGGAVLRLEQDGTTVRGSYPVLDGTLEAEARGPLLVGTWRDPSGSGDFVFSLAPDERSFMGRFGTGEWWTGRRLPPGSTGAVAADASTPETALRTVLVAGNEARGGRYDQVGPAAAVLDFSDLPSEAWDLPFERLGLASALFAVLDELTFRVWTIPEPAAGESTMTVTLPQAGTSETFTLTFRRGGDPGGAGPWRIVVPPLVELEAAATRLRIARGASPEGDGPRDHEELRSPRDVVRTFLEQYFAWEETGDGRLLFSTMNVDALSAAIRDDEAALRARYLKGVIDRIGYVLWQEVPNFPGRTQPYTHFVHPAGTVEIAAIETAEGDRIWQFTPETVASVRDLYVAMEDMPVDVGVGGVGDSTFLTIRNEIRSLDRRLLQPLFGVESWQWLALALVLSVAWPVAWLLSFLLLRVILRWRRETDSSLSIRTRFIRPLAFFLSAFAFFTALRVLGLPQSVDVPLRAAAAVVMVVAGGWLAWNLVDKLGALARHDRLKGEGEMLRSIVVAVAKVVVVIGSILVLAEVLAIPYEGVIAGLGIGGLAVALAAKSTLENFIGGLTIIADKPVRVGDFCRFGGSLGTVEALGLRSVKVRSLDRTVVSIPNAEFVNLQLENYAWRDQILLKTVLQLRYETSPDQMRWILAELRRVLIQHPRVTAAPSRVRFVSFGEHSLNVEVFAYVSTSDFNEYLGIQEDLLLRFADVVSASGSSFAFPSVTHYRATDGLDPDLQGKAEAAVAAWRRQDRLPFPDFSSAERWEMTDTTEFPPPGSPDSRTVRDRQRLEEAATAGGRGAG
jgi:small-conductance mechanosensitive channel